MRRREENINQQTNPCVSLTKELQEVQCVLCVCDWSGEQKHRESKNVLKLVAEKFSKFDENYKCADS